jgi:hypothetical protein
MSPDSVHPLSRFTPVFYLVFFAWLCCFVNLSFFIALAFYFKAGVTTLCSG